MTPKEALEAIENASLGWWERLLAARRQQDQAEMGRLVQERLDAHAETLDEYGG